jgi:ATPase subunit of ABC transporter with duplicated ATPase domains
MKIEVTPSPKLTISVERQQQILDGINRSLATNPRQSFCFTGKPGSGKTFIMKALRGATKAERTTIAFVGDVITLGEWHTMNHASVMGKGPDTVLESADSIRKLAKANEQIKRSNDFDMMSCTSANGVRLRRLHSLHVFLDEIDSQPSTTDFTQGNYQMFINRVYEHTGRKRAGNQSDCVQFVCAMNRTMAEFEQTSSLHVYRRILEMCVIVDFDKATITDPTAPVVVPVNKVQEKLDKEIEGLLL